MKKLFTVRAIILAGSPPRQLDIRKVKTMKRILLLTTLAMGILGDTNAQAQSGGLPLWTNRYSAPGFSYDHAYAVTVDASGNVFVTGYAGGDFNGDGSGFATVKYSGAGVALWTNHYNGPDNIQDQAKAIAVDGSGNVFVTGLSVGYSSGSDYATIAYSGAGVPLWTNRYNGPGNSLEDARAIAVDSSGNVFVTGTSYDSDSYNDYATIKYSGAGVPLWTNRYNGLGNGHDYAYALAVDGSGNVFVTGYTTPSVGGNPDYATIKYSGAGVPLWTNCYDGPADYWDAASAVAVDNSGNVFVTGSSYGSGSEYDYATIKYSGAGVPLWTNRYNGPGNDQDEANAVAVDSSGNVFVTGASKNSHDFNSFDYATIKYSGAGVALWTNRYNGPGNLYDYANAVAVDNSGNVFVTGTGTSYSGISDDYVTIAYSGAGMPLWTNRYSFPGSGGDSARAVAGDRSGTGFVTGYSYGSADDFATIKYSSVIPPSLTIARTTTNTVAISWPSPSTGFTLQQNTNLSLPNSWSPVAQAAVTNAGQISVTVPTTVEQKFFRLQSQ